MRRYFVQFCKIMVIPIAAFLISCQKEDSLQSPPEEAFDIPQEIVAWLQDHAVPFNTPSPGNSFEDLMPLKEMIGESRIVSLGEATHGTREFFEMKHRMLEFLVEEMDFNTFAIEANWPEANLVNDYVHTGEGNPAELLAGLYFWTWNTQEVLDMILWMREHNENTGNGQKVSFFGFDMQFPGMAIDNVINYLQKVDSSKVLLADSLFACFRAYENEYGSFRNYQGAPDSIKARCGEDVQCVYDTIFENKSEYEALSSAADFAHALQSARIVKQTEEHLARRGVGWRDLYMAENVSWILEHAAPEAKIVLWAHNGHVRVDPLYHYSMGSFLRDSYSDDMVIFGFNFYQGSFNAITYDSETQTYASNDVHHVSEPPEGSYSYYFRSADLFHMFLDLRGIDFSSAATSWIEGPRRFRLVGSVYDDANPDSYFYDARLPEEYDVIIYFQDTSPSTLLPFPSISKISPNKVLL